LGRPKALRNIHVRQFDIAHFDRSGFMLAIYLFCGNLAEKPAAAIRQRCSRTNS
jgi:hypothetical protein